MGDYGSAVSDAGGASEEGEGNRNKKAKRLSALLSVAALGVFLEGCSGGGGGGGSSSATPATPATPTVPATSAAPAIIQEEEQRGVIATAVGAATVDYDAAAAAISVVRDTFFTDFVTAPDAFFDYWKILQFANNFDAGVVASLTKHAANKGEAEGDTYDNIEHISGSAYADILEGDEKNNIINGNDGHDLLIGLAGDDTIYGGAGSDFLDGGEGDDQLHGGKGRDQLRGGQGSDVASYELAETTNYNKFGFFTDFTSISYVLFNSWKDTLPANFDGGVVASLARPAITTTNQGEAEGDTYDSIENLKGSDYADILEGDGNNNILHGLDGRDLLVGLAGDDTIYGGNGDDALLGGAGVDVLIGGEGNDMLIGEEGDDSYLFHQEDGRDIVHEKTGTNSIVFVSDSDHIYSENEFTFTRGIGGQIDSLHITTSSGNVVTLLNYYINPDAYTIYVDTNSEAGYVVGDLQVVTVTT